MDDTGTDGGCTRPAVPAHPPIASNAGDPIRSVRDWGRLAPPASAHHWREHRSAFELARAWVEGPASQQLHALLTSRREFTDVRLQRAIAERRSWFDDIPGGPRNHDLL